MDGGTAYTCPPASLTCTSTLDLAGGATGGEITVVTKVAAGWTGSTLHNVAYVDKAPNDPAETTPLGPVPTTDTDTSTTPTDNDAQSNVYAVSVGDYVWWDTNRDGLQTAGEDPIEGIRVTLYAADGTTVLATTATGADGYYSFTGLTPSTDYVIGFDKSSQPGASFTVADKSGTDNSPTTDLSDSDAVPADATTNVAKVAFTSEASGSNSGAPDAADNHGIDAGLVVYNLTLTKKLTTSGTVYPGSTVTYTLTPHNDGPAAALAGWSVTDLLPTGLSLVSMTGTGYTCTGNVCVAGDMLAPATDGPVITVTATVNAGFTGTVNNLAYITPAGPDVPETNPLGPVPTPGTNPATTPTDNDADAPLTVEPRPVVPPTDPETPVPVEPNPVPVPPTDNTPVHVDPNLVPVPPTDNTPVHVDPTPLPHTGAEITAVIGWSLGLVFLGMLLIVAARRRRDEETNTTN